MLINEDFFDKEELDIGVADNSFDEPDNQDSDYIGLIGMRIYMHDDSDFVIDEKFNKTLDNYERAFSVLFGNMGFSVEFERMVSMRFSEIQHLENTHKKDKESDIAKLAGHNYRIYQMSAAESKMKIIECAKIHSDADDISVRNAIRMADCLSPLSGYVYMNYHAVIANIITFNKKLCSEKTPKDLMFHSSSNGLKLKVTKTDDGQYYNSKKLKERGSREEIRYFFELCQTIKPDMTLDAFYKVLFKNTYGNTYEMFDLEHKVGDITKVMRVDADEITGYNFLTTNGTKLHVLNNYKSYRKDITYSFEFLEDLEEKIKKQRPGLYILKRGSKYDWTWEIFFDGAIMIDEYKKEEKVVSTEQANISYNGDLTIDDYDDFVRMSDTDNEDEDDFITQTVVILFTTIFGVNQKAFRKYNEFVKQ